MSHLTNIKTCFKNLIYLEKALNKLNIVYKKQENGINNLNQKTNNIEIIIPQSNNYDVKFRWIDQKYELVFDRSFWPKPYSIESFLDKIAQQYSSEIIIGESRKFGFQPIEYKQNLNSSNILVLERWNLE